MVICNIYEGTMQGVAEVGWFDGSDGSLLSHISTSLVGLILLIISYVNSLVSYSMEGNAVHVTNIYNVYSPQCLALQSTISPFLEIILNFFPLVIPGEGKKNEKMKC